MRLCLKKRNEPCLSPINTDILLSVPHHCLAFSLLKLNDPAGAEKAFQAALKNKDRGADALKLDYARLLTATGRPVEALQLLNETVGGNASCVAAWRLGGEIAVSRAELFEFALDWTGEALKAMPGEMPLHELRAEALLLNHNTAEALPIWKRLAVSDHSPRAMAAAVLCGLVESEPIHLPDTGTDEVAASRAFMDWYRRMVQTGANDLVLLVNSRLETLRNTLPGAAGVLEAVLAEAEQPEELAVT
jgi:tetratricopeptide (TPR) repeat protein